MENFRELAVKTENQDFGSILNRLTYKRSIRLLHGAMGLCTETGELMDMLKKHVFYGKPLDEVNIKEELGDLLWYIALILYEMQWTFDETERLVIAKLQARYPSKFSNESALNRNLENERAILEGKSPNNTTVGALASPRKINDQEEPPTLRDTGFDEPPTLR